MEILLNNAFIIQFIQFKEVKKTNIQEYSWCDLWPTISVCHAVEEHPLWWRLSFCLDECDVVTRLDAYDCKQLHRLSLEESIKSLPAAHVFVFINVILTYNQTFRFVVWEAAVCLWKEKQFKVFFSFLLLPGCGKKNWGWERHLFVNETWIDNNCQSFTIIFVSMVWSLKLFI